MTPKPNTTRQRARRHLAVQVLSGEFTGADPRTFQFVVHELREHITDRLCRLALLYLRNIRTPNHR